MMVSWKFKGHNQQPHQKTQGREAGPEFLLTTANFSPRQVNAKKREIRKDSKQKTTLK